MIVISLGGSIVVPGEVDTDLIVGYRALFAEYVAHHDPPIVVVVGGGAPARTYQEAYRSVISRTGDVGADSDLQSDAQDWIGVTATRLNAELLKHSLGSLCTDPVVYDPTADVTCSGSVLVGAGWKPGFSTDYDAVLLAEHFGADTVVNLSNITKVYTADPKTDPDAQPLDSITWNAFLELVGTDWKPGSNLPFDPVATAKAAELGLRVIAANGRDLENTRAILNGGPFVGTTIAP